FRQFCKNLISHKNFEVAILICIIINCITIALERPAIQPGSLERRILDRSSHFFCFVFLVEMLLKVTVLGLVFGKESYCRSLWNIMAGFLVVTYGVDILLVTPGKRSSLGILNIPHVLRPLRMVERTPKLRLTVEALFRSVKPMGNIIVICGIFFFFYSIVGVQAIISVFVMYSMDGWVNLMYDGLDAVGVDQQPVANYNLWMLLYFISFILMSFILLDMFIGVMVETFHKCQLEQRKANDPESEQQNETEELTYFHHYSPLRLKIHSICTNEALEYFMNAVILLNVLMMGAEHYENPGVTHTHTHWAERLVCCSSWWEI
ncbi:hypothetical protein ILYODFUR_013740, partial [Ilyodon furcidens]